MSINKLIAFIKSAIRINLQYLQEYHSHNILNKSLKKQSFWLSCKKNNNVLKLMFLLCNSDQQKQDKCTANSNIRSVNFTLVL